MGLKFLVLHVVVLHKFVLCARTPLKGLLESTLALYQILKEIFGVHQYIYLVPECVGVLVQRDLSSMLFSHQYFI